MKKFFGVLLALVILISGALLCVKPYEREFVYPKKYTDIIEQYSSEYGLEQNLLYAVVCTESGFDKDAVSSAGAIGLTQITEETYDWIKWKLGDEGQFSDLFDPETSIRYGTYYIYRCMDRYSGDISTRAAAYHSGWGLVDDLLSNAGRETLTEYPYAQMNNYVKKINNAYQAYLDKYGDS